MDPHAELERVRNRFRHLQKVVPARPHSERAHLIQLRRLLNRILSGEANFILNAADDAPEMELSQEDCLYCLQPCLAPVHIHDFEEAQQIYWDHLQQRYSEAVARDFFSQAVAELDPADVNAWMNRLEHFS